jgi:hypothetical protein
VIALIAPTFQFRGGGTIVPGVGGVRIPKNWTSGVG